MNETVKDLYRDLSRKFQRHGTQIEQMWQSLDQTQRVKIMKSGSSDGLVLKDPLDTSLGNVYKLIPEWNLRDIASPSSNLFLQILEHRASTSLPSQYRSGVNGGIGDHEHILYMMQTKGLKLANASKYKDCYTLFLDEDDFGNSIRIVPGKKVQVLAGLMPGIQAQLIVPQATGELILMRQLYLLQHLNIIIEDILGIASTTRTKKIRPKKPADAGTAALARLSVHSTPKKLELSHLIDNSLDHKSSLEDYINLVFTEPTVLAHEVNFWFFTRPELVADEKGRMLPVHTDKFISGAVFDAAYGTIKAAAVWNYLHRLLSSLKGSPSKKFRAIVLQEISNTCHQEYARAQEMFKRSVSTASGGNKWFKRASVVRKDGITRISMKRNPETLTVENPQLHYMLRLCQEDMGWSRSVDWLQKLEDLHRAHPLEKDKMWEREFDALGELAIIVIFIQTLSSVLKLPPANPKKGQTFLSQYSSLGRKLEQIKSGLDLGDYAIPIDNLLEPNMADKALAALDRYVWEQMGTKSDVLYQKLVDDSVASIYEQYEQETKAAGAKTKYITPTVPEAPKPTIEKRGPKEKTRPDHSSMHETTSQPDKVTSDEQPVQLQQTFKVKASTFAVFSSLLSRSSKSRGSVGWSAFAAAMAELGFSVIPKVGSIYTFVPPESMAVQRDLTLHRPHQACIEGPRLLVYSRRLKRVYGWDDSTFSMLE
ncbi:ipa protein [Corynespora cassiicola Philippines]|uniref:Ipa protein n=1 Tax=Corynespora cassiicola Philippines TaxID=1448308 RepID=A0A2T2NFV5_CORCC|nr:ipa protein [Corynespora cassiicola Philippines]